LASLAGDRSVDRHFDAGALSFAGLHPLGSGACIINIRLERPEDFAAVRVVNEEAFEQSAEANIVDQVRRACPDSLSLVAEDGNDVVGHILFSPVVVETSGRRVTGMGLAPMAVVPDRQRQGIGTRLVERGLVILRERDCPYVVVLGHPGYYPRFGFRRASNHGLSSQWEGVPDEAFMVLILDGDAMAGTSGVARYRDEFNDAM
jgi:putative acetyltransferase